MKVLKDNRLNLSEVVIYYIPGNMRENTNFLLLVRVARLVRIVRIVRNIRFFRELRTMVLSIFHTLKSLIWSFVVIFTVMNPAVRCAFKNRRRAGLGIGLRAAARWMDVID